MARLSNRRPNGRVGLKARGSWDPSLDPEAYRPGEGDLLQLTRVKPSHFQQIEAVEPESGSQPPDKLHVLDGNNMLSGMAPYYRAKGSTGWTKAMSESAGRGDTILPPSGDVPPTQYAATI